MERGAGRGTHWHVYLHSSHSQTDPIIPSDDIKCFHAMDQKTLIIQKSTGTALWMTIPASHRRWDGKVNKDSELLLIIKSRRWVCHQVVS